MERFARNSVFTLTLLMLVELGRLQMTQEEFRQSPLVSSETRASKECPGTEETEEVRLVEGQEVRAVYIHDDTM